MIVIVMEKNKKNLMKFIVSWLIAIFNYYFYKAQDAITTTLFIKIKKAL